MRIKAIIAYDGTDFVGYQVQPNGRTVQQEIEKALQKMHKGPIKVVASGRTDARVHATGQVIHFDTSLTLTPSAWQKALNVNLPSDIRVMEVNEVAPNFHARFDAVGKRYRYIWSLEEVQLPFRRNYAVFMKGVQPNIEAMQRAATLIVGEYDFSAFCAANTSVIDKVRTVHSLTFEKHSNELHMVIEGNGFLYNMVRIIAGTLWEVGIAKRSEQSVKEAIESCQREKAGKTAPAQGLYLEKVWY
ncbi:tRNA pseudouridine(38-40) synthase TruA [Metalysinibacillus jejuensis]|uniref:tRNA pseudouridine(38-40) synthase TruA n=1 Tax=Metalysinibacillus jejuensis TaxID=914327 RepID=UPI000D365BC3|nr:tRNA pseudouridine(38-40) synthase TruA [Metalysinibacillus jejuensis]